MEEFKHILNLVLESSAIEQQIVGWMFPFYCSELQLIVYTPCQSSCFELIMFLILLQEEIDLDYMKAVVSYVINHPSYKEEKKGKQTQIVWEIRLLQTST